jgi:hypothetical protein
MECEDFPPDQLPQSLTRMDEDVLSPLAVVTRERHANNAPLSCETGKPETIAQPHPFSSKRPDVLGGAGEAVLPPLAACAKDGFDQDSRQQHRSQKVDLY